MHHALCLTLFRLLSLSPTLHSLPVRTLGLVPDELAVALKRCAWPTRAPCPSPSADPVNEAPYIVSVLPSITLDAFRNTPLQVLALGLLPSGQPSLTNAALFADPDNDTMTLAMLSPPALGSATVNSATGVLYYKPPFMPPTAPGGITTSLTLQASDPSGLKSPPLNVTIAVGEPWLPGTSAQGLCILRAKGAVGRCHRIIACQPRLPPPCQRCVPA